MSSIAPQPLLVGFGATLLLVAFVLLILVLLPGIGRGLAGLGVLLCLLVLVALASEALYALLLAVGYGGYRLWHRRHLGAQQNTILPPG